MEKMLKILLLSLLLSNSSILSQTSIAVIELQDKNISVNDASTLTERLRIELYKTGKFNVLERKDMVKILKEQKFQLSGCTSEECAVEIGQLIGVEQIVCGSVSKFGFKNMYSVNVKLVSVETGKIIRTATYDYEGAENRLLTYCMKNIAYQLAGLRLSEEYSSSLSNISKKKQSYTKMDSPFKITLGIDLGILSQLRNGNYISIWLGGSDNELGVRLRGLYAKKDIPQVFYRDGFGNGRVNGEYGLFLDYSQANFSGFWGGIGIVYLEMVVGHEKEVYKTDYELVSLAFSTGVMGRIISNLYINLWLDTHFFVIGEKEFKVGNQPFVHDDLGFDFSISLGWHF